ncbi:hypothetical protein ACFQZ4_03295 [Catellatospora coxensis]
MFTDASSGTAAGEDSGLRKRARVWIWYVGVSLALLAAYAATAATA